MKFENFKVSFILILLSINERYGPSLSVHAAKYTCGEIYGELIHANQRETIPDHCFMGLNASNCTVIEDNKDGNGKSFCPTVCSRKATIDSLNGQKMRKRRITKCGSVTNGFIDSEENFELMQGHNGRGFPSNIYGYEFRWRAKGYELDTTIVSCPLKRTACTYVGDILIDCKAALDDTYLAGYKVFVELKRVYRDRGAYPANDDNFVDDIEYPKVWWRVKSCYAIAIEVNSPPDTISEFVKFYWTPNNYVFSEYQLSAFIILPILFFYFGYVRYFATECIICSKKNAFLSKQGVCLLCRCYGAELPPPEVIARLKAEKAAKHNHHLNRESLHDSKIAVTRLFGIYQVGPFSCKNCCYMIGDCCSDICFQLKRVGWWFIALITCGRIVRHRRPKIHAIIVTPNDSADSETLELQEVRTQSH